jgi:murein L,D-transpeptidase YcbB/YkuD
VYRLLTIPLRCGILFLIILSSQCTHVPQKSETSPDVIQKSETSPDVIYAQYADIKLAGFQKEITRLKEIADKSNEPDERASAHLHLAFLYSHYRNPSPHYQTALNELALYASLDPEGCKSDTIQSWIAALRQIVELEMETKSLKEKMEQSKNLEKEYRDLKEKVEQSKNLEKENRDLKEKVEQLKELDIELEKRRKTIK